jgi:TonB family protein
MTRHSDPRFGETTYRLINIDRSEPAKSLFEVPADYTIKTRPFGHGEGAGFATGGGIGTVTSHRVIEGTEGEVLNGRAITLPKPRYPQAARAARATGNVTVDITIDEDGNVTAAKAVSGHPLLQATSVEAARNAKFSPGKVSGQEMKVHGVLVFAFPGESGQSSKENEW